MFLFKRTSHMCLQEFCTVDDRQMGHVNQVGHLSKTPLNLIEIHEICAEDTSESKQQNYDHI